MPWPCFFTRPLFLFASRSVRRATLSLALTADTLPGGSAVRSTVCAPPGFVGKAQPRFRGLFKSRRASSSAVSRAFRSLRFARNSAASSSATSRALRSLRFAHKAASSLLALALALDPDSRMIRRTDFRAKSVSGTSAFSRAMVHSMPLSRSRAAFTWPGLASRPILLST